MCPVWLYGCRSVGAMVKAGEARTCCLSKDQLQSCKSSGASASNTCCSFGRRCRPYSGPDRNASSLTSDEPFPRKNLHRSCRNPTSLAELEKYREFSLSVSSAQTRSFRLFTTPSLFRQAIGNTAVGFLQLFAHHLGLGDQFL